jgi:hypothetical protein
MLDLLFEHKHRVIMVRFSDRMTMDDLGRLDSKARAFAQREGPVRGIVDFTAVTVVDIPSAVIANLGMSKPIMGQAARVYVVPQPELFGLGRIYGTYQRHGGNNEPTLVATLAEAYAAFDLHDPDFQPLP